MRRLLSSIIPCVLLCGCFGPGEGVEVPKDQIYFPTGLALDRQGDHLFVVSSDYDLQYNGGAVQSYDLNRLEGTLPTRCDTAEDQDGKRDGLCAAPDAQDGKPCTSGERGDQDRLLFPGLCNPLDPAPLQVDRVKIGAFATDAVVRTDASGTAERLFVPVRGDSTLHWLDVDGGKMECGQSGNSDNACDDYHRAGDDPQETTRGLTLDVEPFAIAATEHGNQIVVTNQTTGHVALFNNDWNGAPTLDFVLGSDRLPRRPVGVAPIPGAPGMEGDTFLLTFRDSAQVRLFRYAPDVGASPDRPYLVDGGGVGISANSVGSDSRGIATDSSARDEARARCAADDQACLDAAALVGIDVYVANRAPATLLIGRTRPPQEYPYFYQTVPLTIGPSRVVVGKVRGVTGELETRVFVVCFDSRRVFVYDPKRARIETEIFTGRGPHALAVDEKRALLYVGNFTDSYVGVFSLDLAFPATYGTAIGTLGTPKSPRSSK